MTRAPIYLDHHATTPLDHRVFEAMRPWLVERFGNADSRSHRYGRAARDAVEEARAKVAALVHARPDEITFTSCATESNTLALAGLLDDGSPGHAVTQATEHRAVLEPLEALRARGVETSVLPVDERGRVSPDAIAAALSPKSRVVSIMLANNEIGTAQPVADIARICEARGVAMHVDAAQGAGYLPLDVRATPVDLVSLSAHKMYGPQGVGALFLRRFGRAKLHPVLRGGGQEHGLRSGTLNVAGIVGFGTAAEILVREGEDEARRLAALRDSLFAALVAVGARRHGDPVHAHPGNLNLRFDGVSADRLLVELEPVLALSTGSACSSGGRPSHVLVALGLDEHARRGAIRIGIGRGTTDADVELAKSALVSAVTRLRERLDDPGRRS